MRFNVASLLAALFDMLNELRYIASTLNRSVLFRPIGEPDYCPSFIESRPEVSSMQTSRRNHRNSGSSTSIELPDSGLNPANDSGGIQHVKPLVLLSRDQPGSIEEKILQLAQTKEWALLNGEPGAGKRYYAEMLHKKSTHTRSGEFIEVTPLTSDGELKAILFNEGRGRAEGMLGRRIPCVDTHTTLFVNHVDEFSMINQTRIARFLIQNDTSETTGEPGTRVIFSTCISWHELLNERLLVESLDGLVRRFHHLIVPPLRERGDELASIVDSIFRRISTERRLRRFVISDDSLAAMKQRPWRDNVLELNTVLEEATRRSRNATVDLSASLLDEVEKVQEGIRTLQMAKSIRLEDLLGSVEKSLIQRTMARCKNNLGKTARLLGLTEQNLRYRIRKYGLYIPQLRKRK